MNAQTAVFVETWAEAEHALWDAAMLGDYIATGLLTSGVQFGITLYKYRSIEK